MHRPREMGAQMAAGAGFSGRAGLILAMIGSAVGLGSIWKFPYEVGQNGGGAFVLLYALGLGLVVLPLLLAELVVGARGGADAPTSLERLAVAARRSPAWRRLGWLMVAGGLAIMSYYAVFGGLAAAYAAQALAQGFAGLDATAARARFAGVTGAPLALIAWQSAFLLAALAIVARGVGAGIERACRVLMPALALVMLALAVHGAVTGGFRETLAFLLAPRLEALTPRAALEALGLGFFSIGVGMGVFITYAAEAPRGTPMGTVALATLLGDSAISLLAGFAVFPLVFAHGLDPAAGTALIFLTLPVALGQMPLGSLMGFAFFAALAMAALASAISLIELAVAPLVRRRGWSRARATAVVGGGLWLAGLPAALSFNLLAGWRPLAVLPGMAGADVVEALDALASNLLLPLAGIGLAWFLGRVVPDQEVARALGWPEGRARWLRRALASVVPLLVLALLLLGHLPG